ncbi:acyl-CoA synthetase [Paenarthrobacter nitroguajacolicus]|uniref:class I adenylate-forming enzyme family protein n=1 Tax=Paenarthrobacter nitroguajacolicus TaxID=211146 RepID=UPI0015BB8A29|nr:AMP-binding protein [Paenarthrobacter nitroguajacolicus]NWL10294.1 acyl-CoA synthetase [Paenarthrobacter nitroguajacolicus]
MTSADSRPWTSEYTNGLDPYGEPPYDSIVVAWRARVASSPNTVALRYFDGTLTADQLDRASDALAVAFASRGTARGDRVGVYLQNIPQYAITLLALWKLGAIAVPLNPMYRRRELRRLVDDAGAVGIICADNDIEETAQTLARGTVRWIISTSPLDFQSRNDPRVTKSVRRVAPATQGDVAELIREFEGQRPDDVKLSRDDVALITYTSGTTGPPKGAMNTHGNVLAVSTTFSDWAQVASGDVVLAVAPLFHITGAVINAVLSLTSDTTLVFTGRFHPEVVLEAFAEFGVTYTIGSITAFNAIAELPQASAAHFASVRNLYSGGAPVPPATVERFRERFGVYVHNAYGLTETTSGVIAVPPGAAAPVHTISGTLSIGVPLPNVVARILDPDGVPVSPGLQGELELSGPQVISGYWNNSEASRLALPDGRLLTGDVAIMDERGWVYVVDRIKDQINVSGFKVWPREVEDALYEHPAVHEAAVVGQHDDYRGETVVAFVSLKSGASATAAELIAFTRQRLAAYKSPRTVHIVESLPKTQTGKILRRELRDSTIVSLENPSKGVT